MFLSIPCAEARRESQGTRDTTPVCAICFTARRRCTRYWRRAPCLWAQHTRGPLNQGPRGVLRTRLVDPLTGDRAALQQAGRCGDLQVRFKTAPLVSGSRPVAELEVQALDPFIISLRHCARHRGEAVAAGQAARRRITGCSAPVYWGTTDACPHGVTQSDSRSDELERRVTTATPFCSPMELGKEPPQRRLELTTHGYARQAVRHVRHANTTVRLSVAGGGCGWRLPMAPANACGQSRSAPWI